jgi:predicted metal-dependent hydrolase
MTRRYRSIDGVKDARYLIRITNPGSWQPAQQAELLAQARALVSPFKGKAINLRVSPQAIAFDLFIDEARHLFNEHRFWEVHEVLEGLWKEVKGSEKELVQGLILAAAALVHVQKDEPVPVWPMLADAMRRLNAQPDTYYGWDVAKFRDHFQKAIAQKKIFFPTV